MSFASPRSAPKSSATDKSASRFKVAGFSSPATPVPVAGTKAGAKGLYKEFDNYPERQVEELIGQRNAARRHAKEWRQTAEVAQRKVLELELLLGMSKAQFGEEAAQKRRFFDLYLREQENLRQVKHQREELSDALQAMRQETVGVFLRQAQAEEDKRGEQRRLQAVEAVVSATQRQQQALRDEIKELERMRAEEKEGLQKQIATLTKEKDRAQVLIARAALKGTPRTGVGGGGGSSSRGRLTNSTSNSVSIVDQSFDDSMHRPTEVDWGARGMAVWVDKLKQLEQRIEADAGQASRMKQQNAYLRAENDKLKRQVERERQRGST